MNPPSGQPPTSTSAVYDLEDIDVAMKAFGTAASTFNMSAAMDLHNAVVLVYEGIFTYVDK